MDFLGVGVPELAVIIVLALIFVGPRDLPKLAARAAKALREIRQMSEGITSEWQREVNAVDIDLGGIKELRDELTAAQESVRKVTSTTLDLNAVTNPKPKPDATPAAKPTPPDTDSTPTAPTPPAEEPAHSDSIDA